MSDNTSERKANPIKSFLSGGFGGICTVLSGHPLDTIKVRLQTMPPPPPGQPPMFKGTFDCAAKTIKHEGFLGLYKGMSAPLTGVAPIFALCFAGYALGKRVQQTEGNTQLTYRQTFVAGSFSGLLSTIITAPGERIKCLLQIQQASSGTERKYNGMLDCAMKLYKEGGLRSIYKGSCATLLRDLPANGCYFLVYEYLQELAKKQSGSDKVSLTATLFAGGSAGIAYWIVGMPADVLKSRLQTDVPANGTYFVSYEALTKFIVNTMGSESEFFGSIFAGGVAGMAYWILGMPADVLKSRLQTAPEGTYKHGIREVFLELMKKDGPLALYRGVTPVMIRAFPANAACFFGIELCNKFLTWLAPNF